MFQGVSCVLHNRHVLHHHYVMTVSGHINGSHIERLRCDIV
jgi:hypothetical protein